MDQSKGRRSGFFKAWREPLGSFVFFFFLLVLPVVTAWLSCETIQANLEREQQQQSLDEMAEMTAHMARLANPETYFQEALRRLNDSFRWASETADIGRISRPEILELFLFDAAGNRLNWPAGEPLTKKKISEDYLRLLLEIRRNPGASLTRRDQSVATSFSGNYSTVGNLARNPETLVNFQGIGLRKYGAWFETRLPGGKEGYLLAWMHPESISRYQLAEEAIRKIQKLAGKTFVFAWIDLNDMLNNSCSAGRRLQEVGLRLLAAEGLKSGFKLANELFAINDTPEGIRLVCARQMPLPPPFLQTFFNLLRTVLPVIVLFLIWKTAFRVRFDLSASLQFLMIFGFTALTGVAILLTASMAYKYEKQNSLVADNKQRAVEILEKIDRNFSASYGDLLHQYRHLISQLSQGGEPEKILAPLTLAQKEENLAFAGFTDQFGNFLFKAPAAVYAGAADSIESKYANLIGGMAGQVVRTFNSSRMPGTTYSESDPVGMRSLSSRPVEGLLGNRSTLQNITFDGDETLTFMDLTINEGDTASGCLFIVHEPRKMQIKYLSLAGQNISRSAGFELAAFPKRHSEKGAYYPRFSYTAELPLWKLHDLVNQTQVSSFRHGRIDDREVLVAAIAGHNLKNYNLFLIMPFERIRAEAQKLSNIFIAATVMSLLFIMVLSLILVKSLITPVSMLAANATALQNRRNETVETVVFSEANELESISTGLTDLILKVREFNEGRSVKRHLLPPEPLRHGAVTLDGFQIANSREEREIYNFSRIDENLSFAFLMRTDLSGIEASLTLSMARMAVRLITEELNVHSTYHCIKDLEEYFRINLRRRLGGDLAAIIVNHAENRILYSGCGAIKIVLIDPVSGNTEKIQFSATEPGTSEFHAEGTREAEFAPGRIALIVSPVFSDMCSSRLPQILPEMLARSKTDPTLREYMQQQIESACASGFTESASLLVLQHHESGEQKS